MRKSKYNARKVTVDGVVFDSQMEAQYYQHLKVLEQAGEVTAIRRQPTFELQPKFRKHGKTYRAVTYRADFEVVYVDGHVEIIDIKGMATPVFQLKRKWFERQYLDHTLTCLRRQGSRWTEV